MSLLQIEKAKYIFKIYSSTHPKLTLKSVKNCKSHERHLAVCANIEKDVEIFNTVGSAASTVTSYIEKRNAIERDVDGDRVERSFSVSI